MIYKCLGCRGLTNAGLLPNKQLWVWKPVTIKRKADYHLVRLKAARREVSGGGMVWAAETACGMEFDEEVQREDG